MTTDTNGVEVRTLEELRDNFDVESVIGHFKAGELRHRENIARLKADRENRF